MQKCPNQQNLKDYAVSLGICPEKSNSTQRPPRVRKTLSEEYEDLTHFTNMKISPETRVDLRTLNEKLKGF